MEEFKKKLISIVVKVAGISVKDDINSTGSDWAYQPKMPHGCEKYKKASK